MGIGAAGTCGVGTSAGIIIITYDLQRGQRREAQLPRPPASGTANESFLVKGSEFEVHKDRSGAEFFRAADQATTLPRGQLEVSQWLSPTSRPAIVDREIIISQLRDRVRVLMERVAERDDLVKQRDAELASLRTELAQGISIASQREVHTKAKRDAEEEFKGVIERERAANAADRTALHEQHSREVSRLEGLVADLKAQLKAAAVARAKDAVDMQRLEERRINLLEDVTLRVAAQTAAEAQASPAGVIAKEQAAELQRQRVQIEKLVHENQSMAAELEHCQSSLPAVLRAERLLTSEQRNALDTLRTQVSILSHEREVLTTRLEQATVSDINLCCHSMIMRLSHSNAACVWSRTL